MSCHPSSGQPPRPLLTDAGYDQVAGFFKVLAEPLRLKLLNALYDGEQTVNQLIALTGGNQANVSKHLKVLLDAGLVARRKEGTNAYYGVADPIVFMLCEAVCARQQAYWSSRARSFGEDAS